jgi:hypothetical protein
LGNVPLLACASVGAGLRLLEGRARIVDHYVLYRAVTIPFGDRKLDAAWCASPCVPSRLSCQSPHLRAALEWEQPYIDRLLWHAKTFGREAVQRYFADWQALVEAIRRLWAASYRLRPADAPWDTWQTWIAEYRTLGETVPDTLYLRSPDDSNTG